MYTFLVSVIKKHNMIGIIYMYVLHISAWVILHYRSMNEKIVKWAPCDKMFQKNYRAWSIANDIKIYFMAVGIVQKNLLLILQCNLST